MVKKSFHFTTGNEHRHIKLSFCGTVSRGVQPNGTVSRGVQPNGTVSRGVQPNGTLACKNNCTDKRTLVLKPIKVFADMHTRRTK